MPLLTLDAAVLERFGKDYFPAVSESLRFFGPEIQVTCAILAIFLADAFIPRRFSRHMAWPALAACLAAAISVVPLFWTEPRALFLGMTAIDPLANFFKMFLLLGTVPVILLSYLSGSLRETRMGEYYGILLAAVLGGMLMASANHLIMAFLALELLSISSYILVGYLKTDPKGAEASLKYIIYGSVAAGIMIYGLSLLYGLTGSGDFRDLGRLLEGVQAGAGNLGVLKITVTLAILLSFAGLAFKMAAIPMHFWCPDVYEGAPTAITAFLSVVSKAAGFALALRFLHALKIVDVDLARAVNWPIILAVLSMFTMTLGNMAALGQDNLKRMLAYSSIAHAGYMMMGLVVVHGQYPGMGLVAYYLLAYLAMNLGAFAIVILVEERLGSVDIGCYTGLGRRSPFLAAAMTLFLFSLIGIPPTAGFTGKLQLFQGILAEARTVGWPYYLLTVVAIVNTAVSVYYYARVIGKMYLVGAGSAPAAVASPGGAGTGDLERIRFPVLGTALVALLLFLTFYLFFRLEAVSKITLKLTIFS